MEEPIRFADILFTALTLLIIYLILFYVNKSKRKNTQSESDNPVAETADRGSEADAENS